MSADHPDRFVALCLDVKTRRTAADGIEPWNIKNCIEELKQELSTGMFVGISECMPVTHSAISTGKRDLNRSARSWSCAGIPGCRAAKRRPSATRTSTSGCPPTRRLRLAFKGSRKDEHPAGRPQTYPRRKRLPDHEYQDATHAWFKQYIKN